LPKDIRHIAVIRLSAMGDVAMTVPTLLAFVEKYPSVKVTVVSRSLFEPIFFGISNVSFFAADVKGRHKGFLGLMKLKTDLQHLGIDAVVDLHDVIRSRVITTLMKFGGVPTVSIDKARAEKKALTRSESKVFVQLPTVAQRNSEAFAELGFPIVINPPIFLSKRKLSPEVSQLTGAKSTKWLGIAPFAKHNSKVYPEDLMKKVIDGLAVNDYKIFLFGAGTKELSILNGYAGRHENIVVPGGKISFQEELQLISNLDTMLSMDSANAHLAAMFGIPVITLWGATHPFAGFAPFAQPFDNALVSDRSKYPKLPTSIYGNKKVAGYEDVMRSIEPEKVIEKVLETIEKG